MRVNVRFLKVLIGIVVVLFVLVGFRATGFRSHIYSKVNPANFKYSVFHKVERGDQTIYLLGTMHSAHLNSKGYSLLNIKAVIENVHPDLLLLESRPEELEKGNWGDGPIEMLYSNLTARKLGIAVDGMDWWMEGEGKPGTTYEQRDDRMVENILTRIGDYKSILVLTGHSHIPEFIKRLKAHNFSKVTFKRGDKAKLFALNEEIMFFPLGMAESIKTRIKHDEKMLTIVEDPDWQGALLSLIEFWRDVLKDVEMVGER